MCVPLHLQCRFCPCMDRQLHLFLDGMQAAGPLNRVAGTQIGALADALYPTAFLIFMHQLLVGTLGFQPARYGDGALGPRSEQTV